MSVQISVNNFLKCCDIYSLIIFHSGCWSGIIAKCNRGRLEKIVKKRRRKKEADHVVGKPAVNFKTFRGKRLKETLMQILNGPTPNETLR